MNEFEPKIPEEEIEEKFREPTIEEIYTAIEGDIPPEHLDSMKKVCGNDKGLIIGAFIGYLIVYGEMNDNDIEELLIKRGILE